MGGGQAGARLVRALLDEQFSPLIAKLLRERGLDVVAAAERADLIEASDREVVEAATREQRAVVTNDIKDFRPIAIERITDGRGHAGLILVPANRDRGRDAAGTLADAIETLMRAHPDGVVGAEHWLPPAV
jgi:NADP-dependent 3-hydroxy acid dehydrogenase YdfG